MSISAALQSAVSGLSANARMLDVTSGNLANQLTEGYAARTITLGAPAGSAGGGVRVVAVDRAVDPELTAVRRRADAELAQGSVTAEASAALARALGETGEPGSLVEAYTRFERALGALAETPESGPRQRATVEAGEDLALAFNRLNAEAGRIRGAADSAIAREVDGVNMALEEIARLNRQIQVSKSTGRDTAQLEDARERQIDRVSAALPVRETRMDDGRIELKTEQGLTLLDRTARRLSFTPTPVVTDTMDYAQGTGALSGLTLGGIDIAPGSGRAQGLTTGGIAAHFAVRDRIVPEFTRQIDALAADLVRRGDLGTDDPTRPPGTPGIFTDGGTSLDPMILTGLSGRLALNPALDPEQGGEPSRLRDGLGATAAGPTGNDSLLRALIGRLSAPSDASDVPGLAGARNALGRLAGVMELNATTRIRQEAALGTLSATRATLASEEGRVRAVNEDLELQRLIRLEQAYAANAQVIQVASRMLDQLTGL